MNMNTKWNMNMEYIYAFLYWLNTMWENEGKWKSEMGGNPLKCYIILLKFKHNITKEFSND